MALPVRQQVTYWGLAAGAFLLLLYALGNVILPFLVGGAIAYFLDPIADRLERLGLSRGAATGLIAIFAVVLAILLFVAVILFTFRPGSKKIADDVSQIPFREDQ